MMGRTVDTVIAAMETNHPDLTNQKTLYVESIGAEMPNEATQAIERRAQGTERTRSRRLMKIQENRIHHRPVFPGVAPGDLHKSAAGACPCNIYPFSGRDGFQRRREAAPPPSLEGWLTTASNSAAARRFRVFRRTPTP